MSTTGVPQPSPSSLPSFRTANTLGNLSPLISKLQFLSLKPKPKKGPSLTTSTTATLPPFTKKKKKKIFYT
ncbi:hypothetical protein LguiB_021763 [Lonicera macranthoides]